VWRQVGTGVLLRRCHPTLKFFLAHDSLTLFGRVAALASNQWVINFIAPLTILLTQAILALAAATGFTRKPAPFSGDVVSIPLNLVFNFAAH
jgi:hypothetical protein